MGEFLKFLVLLGLIVVIMAAIRKILQSILKKVVVFDYQTGLLYGNGKYKRNLTPGAHYYSPLMAQSVAIVDTRQTLLHVTGQEVSTADNLSLKLSVTCLYEVADAHKALHVVASYRDSLHSEIQMALRARMAARTADELLESRLAIAAELLEKVQAAGDTFGLKVHKVEVRDVMFPGELKKLFAEVVRAKKEGQAALERARGESAALRSLANAAKLMEGNPALFNLRVLQSLAGSNGSGSTVVLGAPGLLPLEQASAAKTGKPATEPSE